MSFNNRVIKVAEKDSDINKMNCINSSKKHILFAT